uniref:Uncharacterized protein n=1 Tax=Anguilla anguilla TaxID=7936 RepID=A0A0E9TRH1_ANGAN
MKNSHLSGPFQAEFIFCKFDSDIYEFKCTFQDRLGFLLPDFD